MYNIFEPTTSIWDLFFFLFFFIFKKSVQMWCIPKDLPQSIKEIFLIQFVVHVVVFRFHHLTPLTLEGNIWLKSSLFSTIQVLWVRK